MTAGLERDIHTVSRLVRETRAVLDAAFPPLWVRGELTNLSRPGSGHLYFSLKDAACQVRCAMFRAHRLRLGFAPADGQQVLARARVGLYEPRGEFQLVVERLEPDGAGALALAFEQLQRALAAAGLFDPARKRPLPAFPRQVGLITSPTGAALRDLLAVFGRRFPALPLLIYPAQVQGAAAPAALIAALELANRRADCDVLILARGGGAAEELSAFNDPVLVRAIRASAIPVVSGVGHESDLTLTDLAADARASTPSAAAELVAPAAEQLARRVLASQSRLLAAQWRRLELTRQGLDGLARLLARAHPAARLQQQAQRVDRAERQLRWWLERRLERSRDRLRRVVSGLEARSPLATLARGYAMVTRGPDGRVVQSAAAAPPGTVLRIQLAAGVLEACVTAASDNFRTGE